MSIEMDPVRLIELRAISTDIFRVEVIVSSGDKRGVVDHWFLIKLLSGERISGRFLLVDISVLLLFYMAHFLEVLFELLRGGKSWKEREVGGHRFCNLQYLFNKVRLIILIRIVFSTTIEF